MDTKTGEIKHFTNDDLNKMFEDQTEVSKKDKWTKFFANKGLADLSEIFKQGKVIEIEGTQWEIRRADIKVGKPGKMTLKLRGVGEVTQEE